ncbi:hypothetical protein ABK040_012561 [Willaertia magna]
MQSKTCISYANTFNKFRKNYLIKTIVTTNYNNCKKITNDEENNLINSNEYLQLIKINNIQQSNIEINEETEILINKLIKKYKIAKFKSIRESYHKLMFLSQQILFLETADNNLENLFQYNETELTITTEEIPFTMNASTNINLISLGEHCFRFYKNSELHIN